MTVYSPYQTQLHLECQVKRLLVAKERWVPKQIEQRDISAILGSAIAKGLEVYNKGGVPAAARAAAFSDATRLQADAVTAGRVVPPFHQSQWDRVAARAEAAVNDYALMANDEGFGNPPPGLPSGTTIVDVEVPYGPDGGHARPDLIINDGLAPRVPYDYKVTLSLGKTKAEREKNRQRRIDGWVHSFQLMMYAWKEGVLHYYIGMMVLEPEFSFETIPFQIHPETMQMWREAARTTWRGMAEVDDLLEPPTMAANHADQFGPCPYQKACFEHHLDPALMVQDYVRVAR